jgi:DNA polymerase III alpha subunit
MTGFDALKGMGKNAIPEIIAKRPFTSFEDFMSKLDAKSCNTTSLRALAATGCLDSFGLSRKQMFFYAADYKKKLAQHQKKKKVTGAFTYPWPEEKEWSVAEKSALERHYLGESLIGDKVQEYSGFFTYNAMPYTKLSTIFPPPASDLSDFDKKKYVKDITFLQGEVKSFFEFKVKKEGSKIKGETMAKVVLEDNAGNRINVTCFPEAWMKLKDQALKLSGGKFKFDVGCGVYINGKLNWYEGDLCVLFDELVRFASPPQMPQDLAHKKVSLKAEKVVDEVIAEIDRNELLEDIEQELVETGDYDDLEPELN